MTASRSPAKPPRASGWTALRAAVLAAALALTGAQPGRAQELPTEPILRVETGMHTAPIRRIAVDAGERYLATASWDKTVRVWSLDDGRPLRTLRIPAGVGNLGKPYAVALSPDGSTVAAGGWTGPARAGDHAVYLFDRTSGRHERRISGLPNVVNHLAYSEDGRHLAAALGAPMACGSTTRTATTRSSPTATTATTATGPRSIARGAWSPPPTTAMSASTTVTSA